MFSADARSRLLPLLTRFASVVRLPRPHWRYMALFQRMARAAAGASYSRVQPALGISTDQRHTIAGRSAT
jgi:hypothetical protein